MVMEISAGDLDLVHRLARRKAAQCPSQVDERDLISAGYLGLVDAARRWDPRRGPFRRFASTRVLGSMLDQLRKDDPLSRSARARGDYAPEIVSLDAARDPDEVADPRVAPPSTARLEWEELLGLLASHRLRMVVDLRFRVGLTLREVGLVLGLSEPRVWQLEAQALARLRERLEGAAA